MTRMGTFVFRSIYASTCLSLVACSHVAPQFKDTRVDTLRTWEEAKPRKELGPRTTDVQATADGHLVTVAVHRTVQCATAKVTFKETQRVDVYAPPWNVVVPLLASGALGVGLGGYFTATSFGRPDIDDPYSRDELSMQGALGIGLAALAAGVAMGGPAVWSMVTAGDRPDEPRISKDIANETTVYCGREPEKGVITVLNVWTSQQGGDALFKFDKAAATDAGGRVTFGLDPAKFVLPPLGQDWGTVEVDGAPPKSFTPPASAFLAAVSASKDLEQYETFRQRFPGSPEWARLEPRYRQLAVDLKAEQVEAEAARKAELKREQAEWEKETKKLLAKARRLAKKRRWEQVFELLEYVEDPPLEERGEALTAQIIKLRMDATDALEAGRRREDEKRLARLPPDARRVWSAGPSDREVIVSQELDEPLRAHFRKARVYALSNVDSFDTPVLVTFQPAGIVVDVRFAPGKPGRCEGRTTYERLFGQGAGRVEGELCPGRWQMYWRYAFEAFRSVGAKTPEEMRLFRQWDAKIVGIRVWSKSGDVFTMTWEMRGEWWQNPSQMGVRVGGTYVHVPVEWYRLHPKDARGKPSALGMLLQFLDRAS
ncbi:hypothetical protein ACFL6C_08840 [Myxococcota bacterium]